MGFGGLYTATTGLLNSRISLETTSHNIANTNNPYYVRQSALHKDNHYQNLGVGPVRTNQKGHGVSISQIRQIRDEFLDKQIRRELPELGYFASKTDVLTDVEAVFNEITASGLQNVLDDFWNSWHELRKDPDKLTNRALVRESGQAFVESVNSTAKQLKGIQRNIDVELAEKTRNLNQMLDEIAKLNQDIRLAAAEGIHVSYNDLLDRRNALIDMVSQVVPVTIYEDELDGIELTLGGKTLISQDYVKHLECRVDPEGEEGFYNIFWPSDQEPIDFMGKGELGALIEVRDEFVGKDIFYRLDLLVKTVADKVNELHYSGINLNGEGGIPFFVTKETSNIKNPSLDLINIDATNIMLNPEIDKLNNIAASRTGALGDGELAKEIHDLRDLLRINLLESYKESGLDTAKLTEMDKVSYTVDEFYGRIITHIALEREESINGLASQKFLVESIDQNRSSISTVSLDEEMGDLIKYQYSYMANSRIFNTIDEMIETLVNRLGLVGR